MNFLKASNLKMMSPIKIPKIERSFFMLPFLDCKCKRKKIYYCCLSNDNIDK